MGTKAILGRNAKLILGSADPADQAVAELRDLQYSAEPETVDLTSTDDSERDIRSGHYAREWEFTTWWANVADVGQDLITEGASLFYKVQPEGAGTGKREISGSGQVGSIRKSSALDGGWELVFTMTRVTYAEIFQV